LSLDNASSNAALWRRLQESDEYQEMDVGTEFVGLDGGELDFMELTDLAIADDLETCS
jgi:hypothetical protein